MRPFARLRLRLTVSSRWLAPQDARDGARHVQQQRRAHLRTRASTPASSNTLAESVLKAITILYVEDDAVIRDIVLELMEEDGRCIVACGDANIAWAHLQGGAVDVLVTDVNLPGCSGVDLARRWLEGDATRWVILFTGYDFGSNLASLGSNVRAVRKENFEQLELTLAEIGEQLRGRTAPGA